MSKTSRLIHWRRPRRFGLPANVRPRLPVPRGRTSPGPYGPALTFPRDVPFESMLQLAAGHCPACGGSFDACPVCLGTGPAATPGTIHARAVRWAARNYMVYL